MYLAWLLQFVATLVIVGATFRYIELNWPDSMIGRTLAVIY